MEPEFKVVNRVIMLTFFVGSAGVAALLTALSCHYALGVAPAVLRIDAVISAGVLSVLLLLAMAGAREDNS